jgi:hypothetical protein
LELVPGAVGDASRFLAQHIETQQRFDRVADLVEGFETPFGLELLSSVHWVVVEDGATTAAETVNAVHRWGERKLRFTPEQIILARDVLASKGWIDSGVAVP